MSTTSVLLVAALPITALALLPGGCSRDGPRGESQVLAQVDDARISNPGAARIVGTAART